MLWIVRLSASGEEPFVRPSQCHHQPQLERESDPAHDADRIEQAQSCSCCCPQSLARLEALLTGMSADRELHLALEQLEARGDGSFTWLDQRNASLTLMPGTATVPVQVLLELRGRGELGVLITSQEGMGNGAPLSHGVYENLLQQLQQLLPDCRLLYRSDRDGPVGSGAAMP